MALLWSCYTLFALKGNPSPKAKRQSSPALRLENIKINLRPAIGAENIDGRFEYIYDNVPMRLDYEKGELVEVEV